MKYQFMKKYSKIFPVKKMAAILDVSRSCYYAWLNSGPSEHELRDRELLSETFIVEAVYIEDEGHVEISFLDKSGKTKNVILEILGMPESFQKSFDGSEFTEFVPFSSTPT